MKDNWIKISDELPKRGKIVWTWDGKEVAQWNVNAVFAKDEVIFRKNLDKYGITDWMDFYIPNPPVEK